MNGQFNFKPGPFYGRPEDTFEEWIDQFERYAVFANWDENRQFNALCNMLQGSAALYLKKIDLDDVNTTDRLKQALAAKYQLQPSQIFQMRQQIMNSNQGDRSVVSFSNELCNLCNKLNMDDEEQMHIFKKGLKPVVMSQQLPIHF